MRSNQPATSIRCVPHLLRRRRSGLTLGRVLLVALAPGCATAPAPIPPPRPIVAPVVRTPPAAPPVISPPTTDPILAPGDTLVHQSYLHGQFESKQGPTITIRALLKMSSTQPAVGNKGVLFYASPSAQGDGEWIALGDVEVKKPLDPEGRLQLKVIDDDKKFMTPGGKAPTPLVRKARLRLRWEW